MPSKPKPSDYQPPTFPLPFRILVGRCQSCDRTKECLAVDERGSAFRLCHDCLLIAAEHLSGIRWLRNWRAIDNTRRLKERLRLQAHAAGA